MAKVMMPFITGTINQGFVGCMNHLVLTGACLKCKGAIGRIQLRKMKDWTQRRQENGNAIDNALAELAGVRLVNVPEYIEHAEYKHYIFIKPSYLKNGWSRDRIIEEINAAGVPCYQGSCSEIYLEKAFDNTPWRPQNPLINAVELGQTSLMFWFIRH